MKKRETRPERSRRVYLDNAATTKVDPRVLKVMLPYFKEKYGNPSSIHSWGQEAREVIEAARKKVASVLGCKTGEIIFTSCATESNNLALKGMVEAWRRKHQGKPHLIVSPIEHHCILDTAKHLEKAGLARVTWLAVDKFGLVNPEDIKKFTEKNTVLVSVMYVNNEIGTIEPIKEIGQMLKKINRQRTSPIYFHADAVQAIQYLDCHVQKLGVDFLSLSGHKFHGPKGVGVLFKREGTPIVRQQDGGEQEFGLRAGTENVAFIVGLAEAIELAVKDKAKKVKKVVNLREKLIKEILKIDGIHLTGHPQKRIPHIVSFVVEGAEGEAMVLLLDEFGIAASSGSACTSKILEPSHVLKAIGIPAEFAHGSLRLSLSSKTTEEEIDYVLEVLPKIIKKLRQMAPKGI